MVEVDADKMMLDAIRQGLVQGVKERFNSYNSPLTKLMDDSIARHSDVLGRLLDGAIATCTADETFCEEIRSAVRQQLAKLLIQRFGGELEKQVNALKSDPTTRARITLAIEEIVKSK